jgi:alkanesulfonate monooxygenase SsuD/methylene tetrahydromethanopterin reductase-like flavin-dependent oxidoreductase (luciferase family)
VRVGVVILPTTRWRHARETWMLAEEMGFDHAWTYDHFAWGPAGGEPWFTAIPTLTAAAGATSRIRLGTLVASPNFRHPVLLAKDAIAIDDVSEGRFILGLGVGGSRSDAGVLGDTSIGEQQRADRFAEFVEVIDTLLRGPIDAYTGRFYAVRGAQQSPGCAQLPRLPLAVAATGPRGMGLVARFAEIWVTFGDPRDPGARSEIAAFRDQRRRLELACSIEGRDESTIARLVLTGIGAERPLDSLEAFRDVAGRAAEAGVTDLVVHWPRASGPFTGKLDVLETVAAEGFQRSKLE